MGKNPKNPSLLMYVFGARQKAAPYQQRSGTRENITVIVTICADGTSMPLAVIFKGKAYQPGWADNVMTSVDKQSTTVNSSTVRVVDRVSLCRGKIKGLFRE